MMGSSSSAASLLCSLLLFTVTGLQVLALKSPFHPQDLLPLLPKHLSWPILNSLNTAVDILPAFVGAASASASSVDDSIEWKGACFYKNKAWMVFNNNSQTQFGGGTLHLKVILFFFFFDCFTSSLSISSFGNLGNYFFL